MYDPSGSIVKDLYVFANLYHDDYQNCSSVYSSNEGMKTFATLINVIVNNALLHFNSRIKQMPPQIIHIMRFCGRLAAPDFGARAVRWPEV